MLKFADWVSSNDFSDFSDFGSMFVIPLDDIAVEPVGGCRQGSAMRAVHPGGENQYFGEVS